MVDAATISCEDYNKLLQLAAIGQATTKVLENGYIRCTDSGMMIHSVEQLMETAK